MDTAVALVEAYLRVNGYFTIAEYPVVEELRGERHRTLTDIDILAFRFPAAGSRQTGSGRRTVDPEWHDPDAQLGAGGDHGLIEVERPVAEVDKTRFNRYGGDVVHVAGDFLRGGFQRITASV